MCAQWFWLDDEGWIQYDTESAKQLENAFAKRLSEVDIKVDGPHHGRTYKVILSSEACGSDGLSLISRRPVHFQLNAHTGYCRHVVRRCETTERTDEKKAKSSLQFQAHEELGEAADPSLAAKQVCAICMDDFSTENPAVLLARCVPRGSHLFHKPCLKEWMNRKPQCPVCNRPYGIITGTQPKGLMRERVDHHSLPGFPGCGTIVILFSIPSGIQGPEHPNPGVPYAGTEREVYLPDNEEGRAILALFRVAFERRLVFSVGTSITTGQHDCVVWAGIHMKTSRTGGPTEFGYPDETYFQRVKEELTAKHVC